MHVKRISFLLFIFYCFIVACNPTRNVPDGKYLLVKNKIETDTSIFAKDRFENFIKQKPNRKILGLFRFHLWVNNLGHSGVDTTKFKKWLRRIGEEPAILDSEITSRTNQQLRLFLDKNGFFNSVITDSVKTHKKKATVTYNIKYNTPYTIRKIDYSTLDSGITMFIGYYREKSLLVSGERYDEDLIEKERKRITDDLKDKGYYFFNRNYITFQIDSNLNSHQVDIYLYINRVNENIGSTDGNLVTIMDHHPYYIRNIYAQTDYNSKDPSQSIPTDTTFYKGYYILTVNKFKVIDDKVLVRNFFVKQNDRYLQSDLDYTYKKLQEQNVFKFINLYFSEVPRDSILNQYQLDLHIQLTPMDKLDITLESEATNTGGNIGLAGSVAYRNKNAFRGAEVLELKLKGGVESVPSSDAESQTKNFFFFNSYEIGPELSLSLKKFLFAETKTSRYSNPKTNFILGYNHQVQPDYTRSVSNFAFSFSKNPSRSQRVVWYPLDINSVQVDLTPQFEATLISLNDPKLLYTYETHIISSTHLTWSTTSYKPDNSRTKYVNFQTTGEIAYPMFKESLNPSKFIKADFNLTYTHLLNKFNKIVYRLTSGIGVPYSNSSALPFEKSFFAGGANSLRAWNSRTLGPGSYGNPLNIEQGGDIKIETNVEFRNELFEFPNEMKLEGAVFVDAGNIWTLNEDVSRPGGQFSKQALSEFAVSGGVGTRFNFSFFIFRLDFAVKLRDPSYEPTKRWVYSYHKFVIGDITPSLAIGYPF